MTVVFGGQNIKNWRRGATQTTHKKKGTKKIALANLKKCTERGKKAYDIDPVGAAKQGQPASPRFGKKAKK